MKSVIRISLVSLSFLSSLHAAVLGYWRFEDGGFLTDSGPNGLTLTNAAGGAAASQVAAPAGFPTTVLGVANGNAASFDGGDRMTRADNALFTDTTFSVEAFVRLTADNDSTKTIAGHWNSSGDQRGWVFGISNTEVPLFLFSGNGALTSTINSGLPALALDTDYYLAVTVDMSVTSAAGITFYLQNLTSGGTMQTAGVAHTGTTIFDATTGLAIGSTSQPSSQWTGVIDEVRISDLKLGADQLLIPEPASMALLGFGVGLLGLRRLR